MDALWFQTPYPNYLIKNHHVLVFINKMGCILKWGTRKKDNGRLWNSRYMSQQKTRKKHECRYSHFCIMVKPFWVATTLKGRFQEAWFHSLRTDDNLHFIVVINNNPFWSLTECFLLPSLKFTNSLQIKVLLFFYCLIRVDDIT